MVSVDDLPRYSDLMYPTVQAVEALGGSGSSREITAKVLEVLAPIDEQLQLTYDGSPKSVLIDRIDWARSYCKLTGLLDSPKRGLFLLTSVGKEILDLPPDAARERIADLDRQVRAARRNAAGDAALGEDEGACEDAAEDLLRTAILGRLHELTPTAFEEFCMYILRLYDLELTRIGGPGDEGIDGIGTAPISPVLSSTVAVQAKRYDPSAVIARDKVALFQRDAAAAGAERAIMITLAKYSEPARQAARQATPTVDLIDGDRLCELINEQQVGLVLKVDEEWFERFELN